MSENTGESSTLPCNFCIKEDNMERLLRPFIATIMLLVSGNQSTVFESNQAVAVWLVKSPKKLELKNNWVCVCKIE